MVMISLVLNFILAYYATMEPRIGGLGVEGKPFHYPYCVGKQEPRYPLIGTQMKSRTLDAENDGRTNQGGE